MEPKTAQQQCDNSEAQDLALLPGPQISSRPSLPRQQRPLKPSNILRTVSQMASVEVVKYVNAGLFPIASQEPTTELQRRVEILQYAELLGKAAGEAAGSKERLLHITAFNIAGWTAPALRTAFKAMRPLEFETYELVCPKHCFMALIENVKRHPDNSYTSCCKAWGQGWTLQAELHIVVRWLGTSISFDGNHTADIRFNDGDHYTLCMPPGKISGLAGSHAYTHNGMAVVKHSVLGMGTEVDLKEPSMLSHVKKHRVRGYITQDGTRTEDAKITGCWDSELNVTWQDGRVQTMWVADTTPTPENEYGLSLFAVQLNHFPAELERVLPPTDSRRRRDVRALEHGKFEEAALERARLVSLADERRAQAATTGRELRPQWFELKPATPSDATPAQVGLKYRYKGGYWEAREAARKGDASAWQGCYDVCGLT